MKRMLPWIIIAVVNVILFAIFETLGFISPEHFATLSYTVSKIGHDWPFSIWLAGNLTGGLAVHFYWAWRANPMGDGGG